MDLVCGSIRLVEILDKQNVICSIRSVVIYFHLIRMKSLRPFPMRNSIIATLLCGIFYAQWLH